MVGLNLWTGAFLVPGLFTTKHQNCFIFFLVDVSLMTEQPGWGKTNSQTVNNVGTLTHSWTADHFGF